MKKQNNPVEVKKEPEQPISPEPPTKPVLTSLFKRPPMKSSFSQGSRIRQDGKNQFFARTRRGSI
jgi:hypothetical protein